MARERRRFGDGHGTYVARGQVRRMMYEKKYGGSSENQQGGIGLSGRGLVPELW